MCSKKLGGEKLGIEILRTSFGNIVAQNHINAMLVHIILFFILCVADFRGLFIVCHGKVP